MVEAAAARSGAVWREALQLKELGDQEQHALRRSKLFLDREVGRVRDGRHRSAHSAIQLAGSEGRCEVGRRNGDGGDPADHREHSLPA